MSRDMKTKLKRRKNGRAADTAGSGDIDAARGNRPIKDPSAGAAAGALLILSDDITGSMLSLAQSINDAADELGGICDTISAGEIDRSSRRTLTICDIVAGQLLNQSLCRQFSLIENRLYDYELLKQEIKVLLEALERRWKNAA
jgi:hypothetical protein